MKNKKMILMKTTSAILLATTFAACGGGGGGGGGGSAPIVSYPYETVYGDVCTTFQATPGCTFNKNGTRVTVNQDPDYNKFGFGSDDLWYVRFYADGTADIYNDLGVYQYTSNTSTFAGWVSGNTVGVGTSGLFWENVSGGTYWLGKNGVLYNAMTGESNYGQAINTDAADEASDTNFAALSTETNKALVKRGAAKLVKEYGFQTEKAHVVAAALNSWAVAASERGFTTDRDMDRTFKAVFGVEFSSALAAVKDLQGGDKQKMREMTNRTASALGLKPYEAQKFIKGMYAKALSDWGYDMGNISW